jgi:tight adherence protein B
MERLIAAIVFLDVLFLALSFYYLFKDKRERRKKKVLSRLSQSTQAHHRLRLKTGSRRTGLSQLTASVMDLAALESLLMAAGTQLSVQRFLILSLGLAMLLVLPVIIVLRHPMALLAAAATGLGLPYLYLVHRRKQREQMLVRQLPDTLEMIVRALRAGQSVDGALKEIAATSAPPVGSEFSTLYEEMAMGLSFEQALRSLEKRFCAVTDIKIMCTAFIVQRETGGNLTQILAGLADTIRRRFQLKRQVRTLTAEGRTSALILGVLPLFFAVVTWVFNPDYIGLLITHPMGRKLVIIAAALVVCGFTVMRLMTRIDV